MNRRRAGQAAAALIPLVLTAVVVTLLVARGGTIVSHRRPPPAARQFHGLAPGGWLNGVAVARFGDLGTFTRATGEHPQIVVIYTGLATPFPTGEVRAITAAGALPLIQVNPRGIPLAPLAAGRYDRLLTRFAAAVHRAGVITGISFAHEANGDWYPWGCTTPASVYVAAWRHVHQVIGTRHVVWVWTTDHGWKGNRCHLMARYPGAAWTDWVGVDGYLRQPGATFGSVFGATLAVLRRAGKPLLIAEAGAPTGPEQAARITGLYVGARAAGCIGVVYFDSATRKGDYRPQDNRPALAAFQAAITGPPPRR